MARRKFELPGIQDLSKEQEAARALPKEGQHLIFGGPGTGKSVLALLRSRRHSGDGDNYLFLIYNHLLHQASRELFGTRLESAAWKSWFNELFFETTGRSAPQLPPQPNGWRETDWPAVAERVADWEASTDAKPYLIIDEGQDMPPGFYDTLVAFGFENFFVVADQNQQITNENSSRHQLEDSLAVNGEDVMELKTNYRNRYSVARLAREFYTGDRASPPPALPEGISSRRTVPILYSYLERDLNKVAAYILQHADSDPRRLIGVLTPSNQVRERYVEALEHSTVRLDNPKPNIVTSYGPHRPDIAFREGGVLVINAQSCKGLEFDTAILADIDEHYYRASDPDATKRLFYVMVARAIDRVFLFKRARPTALDEILPDDPNILRREVL